MTRRLLALVITLPLALYPAKTPRQVEVKVQKTSLTRDQEIQLGKEAAAQVEREMEIVRNPEIEAWLNQIGQRLARTPEANAYPYYFKLLNDESINAFALPGGPMYVHTGLLKAAESEGEVAGVLGHEMSHVALRHAAAQIGKQQTWGTLFGVLGAAVGGSEDHCGVLCQIAGIGGSSVLMRFSRGYERDADLNGARMIAAAGYDPMELPRFFEKLQEQLGKAGEPKGLSLWLSSHPATGSRIKYVSEDVRFYPHREYTANTGRFPRIKQLVAALPPPKPKPAFLILSKKGAEPRQNIPAGFKDYQANGFAIDLPEAWLVGQAQAGGSLYMIPRGGVARGRNGVELINGAMLDYYIPKAGAAAVHLDDATAEFVKSLVKEDPNLRAGESIKTEVGGKPARRVMLNGKTSAAQEPDQLVYLYTVAREAGLWYIAMASQPSRLDEMDPIFREMLRSIQFPD